MTMPQGSCPRCGEPLANMKLNDETVVVTEAGDILAAQRMFAGECPEHGRVFANWKMGNHSTLAEKELKQRYPKSIYKKLMGLLGVGESRKFSRARHGKLQPKTDDIARWDQHVVDVSPPPVSQKSGRLESDTEAAVERDDERSK